MSKTVMIQHTGQGGAVRVPADDPHKAATAAGILARRMYGARGTVAALRHDSDTVSGGRVTGSTWQAFIGRAPTDRDRRKYGSGIGITGRNVWIYE